MKLITDAFHNLVNSITSIPENLRNTASDKIGDALAEKITNEIMKTLEDEGFDVSMNLTIHIKKH